MTRETVGKISQDLLQKTPDTRDPIEIQREVHKKYEQEIEECIIRGKKLYHHDFFVVVSTKKERLLPNVLRNYFYPRQSCPTPTYDQILYHYHRKDERLELIWVIPAQDICMMFRDHALEIVESERELLGFVIDFYDKTLDKKAALLNKELYVK